MFDQLVAIGLSVYADLGLRPFNRAWISLPSFLLMVLSWLIAACTALALYVAMSLTFLSF
jgi:hypothetical protein